jgi:predicted Zn-dependent protease
MSNYPPAYPQRSYTGQGLGINLAPLLIGLVMAGLVLTRGCQHGPFDRTQVVALTPQQEMELGTQAYREVLSQEAGNVVNRGAIVEVVQRITHNLARASNAPEFLKATHLKRNDFQWDVHVIRSEEINAFCLPGGKMVVYTGILPIARTENGLAVVMGHEISHALAHHGAERMAHEKLAEIGQNTAGMSIGGLSTGQRIAVMRAFGVAAQYGFELPYSRSHESEADHIGLFLMATAGYDPAEAPRFWERMMAASRGRGTPAEILSTHPSNERRIRDLEHWQADARALYDASHPATGANQRLPWP